MESRAEAAEAAEALEAAIGQVSDDCEALLSCLRKQDKVTQAVALGFEACDLRIRDAVADALRVFVDVEIEATSRRLEDLSKLGGYLGSISSSADSAAFIESSRRPEFTHPQSAALSLLHDPNNRGALVNGHQRPPLRPSSAPPRKGSRDHEDSDEETNAVVAGDRLRADMDRIVVSLFAASALSSEKSSSPWRVGSPAESAPAAAVDEEESPMHPLHPLHMGSTPSSPQSPPALTGNEKRRLVAMLQNEAGREALIHALNLQRARRTEISEGFEELAKAIGVVLDKCQQHRDVHTAKMAMMLSQTFYREVAKEQQPGSAPPSRDDREYLKQALLTHPLWEDMSFWDEACWQSISESLKEGQTDTLWHDMSPAEQREAVLRVHNIVFSQVGAYAHSMVEFSCSKVLARKFVRRLAATYQLSLDQLDMLLALVGH